MMSKSLLIICLIFILSGCASNESTGFKTRFKMADIDYDVFQTPEGEKLYCKEKRKPGTLRKTMTCFTKAQQEAKKKNRNLNYSHIMGRPVPVSNVWRGQSKN